MMKYSGNLYLVCWLYVVQGNVRIAPDVTLVSLPTEHTNPGPSIPNKVNCNEKDCLDMHST